MKPLRGGIRLEGKKEATIIPWTIARPGPPRHVRIPLAGEGRPYRPAVAVGDRVLLGERIAQTPSALPRVLPASVSGKVTAVGESIEILSDGKDETVPNVGRERSGWHDLSGDEIFRIACEAGIAIPLPSPRGTLILNACESEPYVTSDHTLLMSHPVEVLRGGEFLKRLYRAESLLVAIQEDKEEVAELLKSKIFFHTWSHAKVEILPALYPQEDARILRHSLGNGKSSLVLGVSQAFALYEAVVLQKPFYERVVTVGGECVAQPKNFWLRLGTPVEEAVKAAKGFLRKPEKVILGGPMRGRVIESLETPVLGETRAVLGLPSEVARPEEVEPCIRCGLCVESCPVSLSPAMITLAAEKDLFDLAQDYGARFCIQCGNCTYVCPSKRPMQELIQYVNAH